MDRLRGNSKEILKVDEVTTQFGEGYAIVVAVGSGEKKKCHLIKDKATNEWKTLGDPNACQILSRNLHDLGTPLFGHTTEEKLTETTAPY